MSVGESARRSRPSVRALRLYDRLGLVVPAEVDAAGGHRRYREDRPADARLVALLRRPDMPPAATAEVPALPGAEAAARGGASRESVERRVAARREPAVHLRIRSAGDEGRTGMFEIREREVPEQWVLTERRTVRVAELPGWIGEAVRRLEEAARPLGGVAAAPFVVYHGEVTEDGAGPVEVCVPVAGGRTVPAGTASRREPAHREAYTRLVKAQVAYPQVLSAYDAVAQWIAAGGRRRTGPGREVYFADWAAAGPDDAVCDVAFPVG
ncbi:MerR family transcriptional regulator [Streptacidiphilus sp. ASG 303]|uniref:MerR family transcriptional regulator n=1 Tax=Streptacidiphilus sp. ASG 303 TaxID=2896847 RepID=UPI002105FFF3|nr:MerR family transcriptional regulator [Streptacidiphilus sp. ASG 303]